MSEKESPSMKALRIVYGDEVIVVQCVPRQVV
ncbi:metal-dependent hydrolase, partial [Escherichia coli]|nr:metal-dependent hydrolase [Escherichia coli]